MNLKTFGVGAAVATSVALSSVTVVAPAQALTLNFVGSNLLTESGSTATLSFANVSTTSFTDDVFGGPSTFGPSGIPLTLTNLNLNKISDNSYTLAAPTSWISGLAGGRTFTLTSFSLLKGAGDSFTANNFTGFFSPTIGVDPIGSFTTQGTFKVQGTSFSTTITAVPAPALLPGLVAVGASVLRKRKDKTAEAVEA
jgi:hypothetical protein